MRALPLLLLSGAVPPSAPLPLPSSPTPPTPAGQYAQLVAFLLFMWAIMGWLLPTLLLLPEAPPARPGGSRLAWALETWLRMLLPVKQAPQRRAQQAQLPAAATCTLHWGAVLLVTWGACSSLAPLFGDPRPAAAAAAAAAVV